MAHIELERRGHVALVTIDRPEAMNALDFAANAELIEVWTGVRDDDDVRAAVLTGAGDRAFCAGTEEAFRIGLVNRICPRERLVDEALALAGRMASRAPLAVQAAKSVVLRGLGHPLEDALRLESYSFYQLKDTEDLAEGTRAFAEKREPRFRGR